MSTTEGRAMSGWIATLSEDQQRRLERVMTEAYDLALSMNSSLDWENTDVAFQVQRAVWRCVVPEPPKLDTEYAICDFCKYSRQGLELTSRTRRFIQIGRIQQSHEDVELCTFCLASTSVEAWLAGAPVGDVLAAIDASQHANMLADLIRGRT